MPLLSLGTKLLGFCELLFDLGALRCKGGVALLDDDPGDEGQEHEEVEDRALEFFVPDQGREGEVSVRVVAIMSGQPAQRVIATTSAPFLRP